MIFDTPLHFKQVCELVGLLMLWALLWTADFIYENLEVYGVMEERARNFRRPAPPVD